MQWPTVLLGSNFTNTCDSLSRAVRIETSVSAAAGTGGDEFAEAFVPERGLGGMRILVKQPLPHHSVFPVELIT